MPDAPISALEAVATSIMPLLSVRGGAEAVTFYRAAFDAQEHSRFTDDKGHVVAQLSIDTAAFLVADEAPDYDQFSPDALGGTTVRIELTVSDPDTVFERAVAAGAREVFPVDDQSWGLRQGRLVDPYGHHWLVSRPLSLDGPARHG